MIATFSKGSKVNEVRIHTTNNEIPELLWLWILDLIQDPNLEGLILNDEYFDFTADETERRVAEDVFIRNYVAI